MTVMYDTVLEADFDFDNDISFDGSIEDTEPFSSSLEIPESVGSVVWNAVTDKPFEKIGDNLIVDQSGRLSVDTASEVEEDNTKPITSAAVYTEVGNINALLALI